MGGPAGTVPPGGRVRGPAPALIRLSDAAPTVAPMGTTRTSQTRAAARTDDAQDEDKEQGGAGRTRDGGTDRDTDTDAAATGDDAATKTATAKTAAAEAAADQGVPAEGAAAEVAVTKGASADTQAADRDGAEGRDEDGAASGDAATGEDTDENADEAADDEAGAEDAAPVKPSSGVGHGAFAVVAAGLGLASVSGTWLGTIMAERQTLLGQIKLQAGKTSDQIAAVYGTPWHTTALVNGLFAMVAVIVGGAVLLSRPRATWTRSLAWGGLALGVLGVFLSAGMYFDLFASMPSIPQTAPPGAGS